MTVAASHQALAFFIVPVQPGSPPLIRSKAPTLAKAKPPLPWFDFLLRRTIIQFHFPAVCISSRGQRLRHGRGVMAVLAQFGVNGSMKSSGSRKEKVIHLNPVRGWPLQRRLAVMPQMFPASSPDTTLWQPSLDLDTANPGAPRFMKPPGAKPPVLPAQLWNMKLVSAEAFDYPCPIIRSLAFGAMSGTLQPFVGNIDAPVDQVDRVMSEDTKLLLREILCKERAHGDMDGPRPYCWFPCPRILPFGWAPKHKFDPTSTDIRLTSDLGALGCNQGPSVNDLTLNPQVIRVHATANFLRDTLASMGPNVSVSLRDV